MSARSLSTGRQWSSPAEIIVVTTHHSKCDILPCFIFEYCSCYSEGMGLEYAVFNTSSVCIALGKLFQVQGDMERENCIVGLQTYKRETQTHPKKKSVMPSLFLKQTHTHTAILGLNVFVTVKSHKVTCMPMVTGSFSCVLTSVCFDVCLPCFPTPVCSDASKLWHFCSEAGSRHSLFTRLPPPPPLPPLPLSSILLSHLFHLFVLSYPTPPLPPQLSCCWFLSRCFIIPRHAWVFAQVNKSVYEHTCFFCEYKLYTW